MEIDYQKVATDEYRASLSELSAAQEFSSAVKKSFARHDMLIAKATEASEIKPACKSGCAFCCYYKVDVRAHEIFTIKEYMEKRMEKLQVARILSEAAENAALIRQLSYTEHLSTNIKCPFLIQNACSIYPVRPFKCRNFHAVDVTGCEKSFLDPEGLNVPTSFIETVATNANAHSQAFEAAIEKVGYDARVYDLNTAIIEVFAEPSALKRFKKGKRSLLNAIEVSE